jgi:hypothetical protein
MEAGFASHQLFEVRTPAASSLACIDLVTPPSKDMAGEALGSHLAQAAKQAQHGNVHSLLWALQAEFTEDVLRGHLALQVQDALAKVSVDPLHALQRSFCC